MTIIDGEVTKAEGREIISAMDIKGIEVFRILTDEGKERLIEDYNENCDDWDGYPVVTIEDLPSFVYKEWDDWVHWRDYLDLVMEVLEERDQEYIHISDTTSLGPVFHTIIEL